MKKKTTYLFISLLAFLLIPTIDIGGGSAIPPKGNSGSGITIDENNSNQNQKTFLQIFKF